MAIYHIEEMAFAGLHFVRSMSIIYAGLISMPPVDPIKSTLEHLDLQNNNISIVPTCYFSGFKEFKTLIMNDNSLCLIPDISPLHNTLSNLQLSRNNIKYISGGVVKTVYSLLQILYLGQNTIQKFDSEMLTYWPSLRVLNLRDNLISHLPKSYPEGRMKQCSYKNASVCDLYFDGNPIHCDKAVEEIITRRQDGYDSIEWNCYIVIRHLRWSVCAFPPYLCGYNLQELSMCNVMMFRITVSFWGKSCRLAMDSPHKGPVMQSCFLCC